MAWEWYEHLIYPDWYLHNRDNDAINAQASKTYSLEHRIDQLEKRIEKMQHHILGLESLLAAHGIVPPTPEEVPDSGHPTAEPVTFPSRTAENITCPCCGRRQKGTRNACYSCGTPFLYADE